MTGTSEHNIWRAIKARCHSVGSVSYAWYGGRGIRVCERWFDSFENFFADMGPRPSKAHSVDRIDNDGNYEPGNCRWATRKEQQRNKRNNRLITYNGETMCLEAWADRLGIGWATIHERLDRGWSVADALSRPIAFSPRWHK